MKKLIFGIALLFVGAAGVIALLACTLLAEPVVYNGTDGWLGCLQSMGLTPVLAAFLVVALLGLAFALCGVFEKKK